MVDIEKLTHLYNEFFQEFIKEQEIKSSTQLDETPARVVRALVEMTNGYHQDPAQILNKDFVDTLSDDYVSNYQKRGDDVLVIWSGIPFNSLCAHHIIPFWGFVYVGILVKDGVVGLSKIPRVVHTFAQRLQIQEEFTESISLALHEIIPRETNVKVKGTIVVVDAIHGCMVFRGAKTRSVATTSHVTGYFLNDDKNIKSEFFSLIAPHRRQLQI